MKISLLLKKVVGGGGGGGGVEEEEGALIRGNTVCFKSILCLMNRFCVKMKKSPKTCQFFWVTPPVGWWRETLCMSTLEPKRILEN